MSNDELKNWLERTVSDYQALVRSMDDAKLGEYDPIRERASNIKNNLNEIAAKVGSEPIK